MLYLSEFVWTLLSSVWVVFNNFLLVDASDRIKISSDQKRVFIAFLANTPFNTDLFLGQNMWGTPQNLKKVKILKKITFKKFQFNQPKKENL